MQPEISIHWVQFFFGLLGAFAAVVVLTLLLLGWVVLQVKKVKIPQDADALTALRATPLAVVILLDLLDLAFDFLSAPLSWVLLGYLGLKPLRAVTVAEAIIPGTQLVPTMTIAWAIARFTDPNRRRYTV
jgi:hypothetical protein